MKERLTQRREGAKEEDVGLSAPNRSMHFREDVRAERWGTE